MVHIRREKLKTNKQERRAFCKPPPGGGVPYERGGDARRNFWIKPPKEANLGVAQPFFTPKSDHFKLGLHESSE